MKIKKLHIENYKSIKKLVLENPNPFSVFVGQPNGAGKSNIFEALEFLVYAYKLFDTEQVLRLFGGMKSILPYKMDSAWIKTKFELENNNLIDIAVHSSAYDSEINSRNNKIENSFSKDVQSIYSEDELKFLRGFSRIFLNNSDLVKIKVDDDDSFLSLDGSNIENVLKRVLQDDNKREEIIEWMRVLIPEFKNIEIETTNRSGVVNYVIYEKHTDKPFPKKLISDGTKNILTLLMTVYQRDEPQFLCIEEPENGLHPQVIEHLVSFFRNACKEKGHYIWLNTHSQTLVRQLTVDEIIVVDKKRGATTARQFQGEDLRGLKMDEAWLTNALGGGLP